MNKERMIWMLILVLAVMHIDTKQGEINNLKALNESNQISHRLQSDQITEMLLGYDELGRSEYNKGFQDGKTHALVSVIHEGEINSYAEGYHAALSEKLIESEKLDKSVMNNLKID
jgi:hypothetical protein